MLAVSTEGVVPIYGDYMPEQRRLTAIKVDIDSIVKGRFVKGEGFNPSYVLSPLGLRLSRIRVLATIVDKFLSPDGKFATITLDDNTATIRVKSFNSRVSFENLRKGDLVDVIGKLRIYNGEIYIVPEVISKVQDPNFWLLRKLELLKQKREMKRINALVREMQKQTSDIEELKKVMEKKYGIEPDIVESILQAQEEVPERIDIRAEREKIIKLIEDLDEGNGCEYSKLIDASGLPEDVVENIVNELLSDGTCFEPRPGYIKLL